MKEILIKKFSNREIKATELFEVKEIEKPLAYKFVLNYHYLKDAKFFAKFCFGLFIGDELVGCSTFSNPQGISAMKSWFGLENDNQDVLELSRLCMLPDLNGTNATSYLLSKSIKLLKSKAIKAVITLADDSRHIGSIYQVCNFKYYGLTNPKTDFFSADGKTNPRGTTVNVRGVWLPRTRKHRYAFILDKNLKCLLEETVRPTKRSENVYDCCKGTGKVFDKRFNEYFDCPKCKDLENNLTYDTTLFINK